ncbi:MAG TPA: sodium:proton antiporter NhaD [Bacteroidales bacterium]|nr:sodium:proton antiporter NhaD [Bacteroidales bacterium]
MVTLIALIFVFGYLAIALEHPLKINKTAIALLIGVLCWTVYMLASPDKNAINVQLGEHLGNLSQILFFLLGAMTIVEMVDAHDGFRIITKVIVQTKKTSLLWIIGIISFFLSSVLDNMTTTIVIVSLLRKLIHDPKDRMLFAGVVVIAANAGGAWTPIGDVTTTMLWIGNQISTGNIMVKLFLPSMACLVVPLIFLSFKLKGTVERPKEVIEKHKENLTVKEQNILFFSGIGALIFVPIFKTYTHLPPYLGMLFGVSAIWILTEIMHKGKPTDIKGPLSVNGALHRIDTATILFFLGILLSIAALEATEILPNLAAWMNKTIHSQSVIAIAIGLLSAVVDNVPLVAACQGMYSYPTDHFFWEFIAFTAGTGGSILIIGSAAGVAAMGMEKIDFIWYMKKISLLAALGFFAGCAVYLLEIFLIG